MRCVRCNEEECVCEKMRARLDDWVAKHPAGIELQKLVDSNMVPIQYAAVALDWLEGRLAAEGE